MFKNDPVFLKKTLVDYNAVYKGWKDILIWELFQLRINSKYNFNEYILAWIIIEKKRYKL